MSPLLDIGAIVIGLLLIGLSRVIADAFRFPGNTSSFIKFAGMGDNYSSRLYRWATAVGVGLLFVVAGAADLLGR
jgi:hypothetical protein